MLFSRKVVRATTKKLGKKSSSKYNKVSIIIPVYNERDTFEKLLKRVLKVKLPIEREIIIIEGNSTDGTRKIVKKYEGKKDIKIYYINKYCGKGYKVRFGIKKSTGDIILIQDADLEYDPMEYPQLLAPLLKGKTKFVLGSRHLGKKTWKIREFDHSKWYGHFVSVGSEATNWYFLLLYGVKLTDPQTMYKIFTRDCLNTVTLKSNEFDLDWEIVIKLCKTGFKPIEVPVSYKARTFEQGKKIRIVRDGFRALWAITKYRFIN